MSQVTTLGIGGLASEFLVVKSKSGLIQIIKQASRLNKKFLVIGSGSNLLVSDKGVNALVIKNEVSGITANHLRGEKLQLHLGGVISVKSGTLLQELVDFTIQHGLSGLQNLTGIPGTVGGAIFGNAGAYGQTISEYITEVVCLNGESIKTLTKDECQFEYRDSCFKKNNLVILEIKFKLHSTDPRMLKREAKETLEKRLLKYRPGVLCPGSFFKNLLADDIPEKILKLIPNVKDYYGKVPAWYFLEQVGAKGAKLGKIEIASYHANLFINLGGGKAADFYTLAKKYTHKVKEKFGITLEPEVQLINLPPII